MKNKSGVRLLALLALLAGLLPLHGQGTAFTYQGRLNSATGPATGSYDLRFGLYDAASSGTQVGTTLTNSATAVTNGLFTATLDFGNQFSGANRWLEIAVRTNGGTVFNTLAPRQPLTPSPYSVFASAAGSVAAANLSGTVALAQLPAGLVTNGSSFSGAFTGNGAGMTNVNAGTLNGVAAGNFWQLGGNDVSAGQFLGSTNNQPVEFRAGGIRALRLELDQAGYGAPNVVGGAEGNIVAGGIGGATIGGGGAADYSGPRYNSVLADFGTVAGGFSNTNNGFASVIGGGFGNLVTNQTASVGGGHNNVATGNAATIGGGGNNLASGLGTTIGGGNANWTTNQYGTVGGGDYNVVGGSGATVAGGYNNLVLGNYGTTAGGSQNTVSNGSGTISGGGNNLVDGNYGTVGGGAFNDARGQAAFVGGGVSGIASGDYAALAGGYHNTAAGPYSFIGGGQENDSEGYYAALAGGYQNQVGGFSSTIAGGYQNTNTGNYSTIGGGQNNASIMDNATIAGGFHNYAWVMAAVGGGGVNTAAGVGSVVAGGWQNLAGQEDSVVGGGIQNSNYASAGVIGGGSGNILFGGDAFIGGGYQNQTHAFGTVVVGGTANNGAGQYAFIGGGRQNSNTGDSAVVGGGFGNAANGDWSAIAGGMGNSTYGAYAMIPGGATNYAVGIASFAAGAGANAGHDNSFVWSDSMAAGFGSTTTNQFNVRAAGGVRFVTGGAGLTLDGRSLLAGSLSGNQFTSTNPVVLTNAANNLSGTFAGSFSGNGSSLTSLNASQLAGGTVPLTALAGITSNQLDAATWFAATNRNGGNAALATNLVAGISITNAAIVNSTYAGNGGGLTNVNAVTLAGQPVSAFAPVVNPAFTGTVTAPTLVAGNAQITGLLRSGSESGTSQAPDMSGLIVRRVNSTYTTGGQIVARTDNLTLERDGSNGGFLVRFGAPSGSVTIACTGMDNTGAQKNFYTTLSSLGAGTVQVYSNAQNIVHFECTFGITYQSGQHLTQVTLSRYGTDSFWSGNVVSTYNQ